MRCVLFVPILEYLLRRFHIQNRIDRIEFFQLIVIRCMARFLQLLKVACNRSKFGGNRIGQYETLWQVFNRYLTLLRKSLSHIEHLAVTQRSLSAFSKSCW